MRASGATATVNKPTYATNEVLDTSSVSSAASSEVSSAVSSALSSAPDVQAQDVSSSTVSAVDNTDARNAALVSESVRHDSAMADINTNYNGQIAVINAELQKFTGENARDTTVEIATLQKNYDDAYANYLEQYNNARIGGYDPNTFPTVIVYKGISDTAQDTLITQKPILQQLQTDYNKMPFEKQQITDIEGSKQIEIDAENRDHTNEISNINNIYP
jgi:hypothetical protein